MNTLHTSQTNPSRCRNEHPASQSQRVVKAKTILGFLGMHDVRLIYAEGLATGTDAAEQGFARAQADLDAAFA
ncbi:MAG: hypothetical protein KJ889_06145 [Gammaproteobacteria bacterium]|nr:hypothetical protein [Gammaproteobacteria bacterium]